MGNDQSGSRYSSNSSGQFAVPAFWNLCEMMAAAIEPKQYDPLGAWNEALREQAWRASFQTVLKIGPRAR